MTVTRFKFLTFLAATICCLGGCGPPQHTGHSQYHAARRAAAEKGDAAAQWSLGYAYEWGREGVPRMDKSEALKWFRKSAAQNYADAQTELGQMYANGEGVPKDEAEAAKWYLKSAEHGEWFAQSMLGDMYSNGQGVPKDEVEAGKWYRKAAVQDVADGKGVPKDEVEAYKWLLLAAAHKHEKAKQGVEILEPKLTPEQRAEGKQKAQEFKPQSEARNMRMSGWM